MTIIFDFDGTLHNTANLYGCAFRFTCEWLTELGYTVPEDVSDERVSKYLGMSSIETWEDFMPELSEEMRQAAIKKVEEGMLHQIDLGNVILYPGIIEMLDTLKNEGCKLFILSNSNVVYMDGQIRHLHLEKWFADFFPGEAYDFIPKRDICKILIEQYPDDHYFMVGDRDSDMEVGELGEVVTIGCTYGFGSPEELASADVLVDKASEIPEVVKNYKF